MITPPSSVCRANHGRWTCRTPLYTNNNTPISHEFSNKADTHTKFNEKRTNDLRRKHSHFLTCKTFV